MFLKCVESNCVPLLVTMLLSTLYQPMMFFHTNCWAAAAVIFGTGSASIYLEKYSMAIKAKQRLPLTAGNGPMMSGPHSAKGQTGGKGYNGTTGAFALRPTHWHPWQRWARSCASRNAVGQYKPWWRPSQ